MMKGFQTIVKNLHFLEGMGKLLKVFKQKNGLIVLEVLQRTDQLEEVKTGQPANRLLQIVQARTNLFSIWLRIFPSQSFLPKSSVLKTWPQSSKSLFNFYNFWVLKFTLWSERTATMLLAEYSGSGYHSQGVIVRKGNDLYK